MDLCPLCDLNIEEWDEGARRYHINKCIDEPMSLGFAPEPFTCPVCAKANFNNLIDLDKHITQCLLDPDKQPILTQIQQKAIDVCHRRAKAFSSGVSSHITVKLESLGYSKDDLELLQKYFDNHVRLVIHVNLDRVLDFFMKDEFYRNLFEVGTSGGSNDLRARKAWENNLFNNVYANASASERVKYGALNLTCNKKGAPAVSYGESFITIRREVHDRISFCVGDSSKEEMHMATFRHPFIVLNLIPLPLLKEITQLAKEGSYNGPEGYPNDGGVGPEGYEGYPNDEGVGRSNYTEYIECQIHGPLSLKRDIESLHVPKICQKDEKTMKKLGKFTELYAVPIIFF